MNFSTYDSLIDSVIPWQVIQISKYSELTYVNNTSKLSKLDIGLGFDTSSKLDWLSS